MTTIKITVAKEVEVDLSHYYKSFSKKLRDAIDQELHALITGEPKAKRPSSQGPLTPDVVCRVTGKTPTRTSLTKSIVLTLCRKYPKPAQFLLADLIGIVIEEHKRANREIPEKGSIFTWLTNLRRDGYYEVVP